MIVQLSGNNVIRPSNSPISIFHENAEQKFSYGALFRVLLTGYLWSLIEVCINKLSWKTLICVLVYKNICGEKGKLKVVIPFHVYHNHKVKFCTIEEGKEKSSVFVISDGADLPLYINSGFYTAKTTCRSKPRRQRATRRWSARFIAK